MPCGQCWPRLQTEDLSVLQGVALGSGRPWGLALSFPLLSSVQTAFLKDFNEDQKKAIETAYAMVKHSPAVAKICLIHGPPGTGKSKTIVGLLYRLLTEVEAPGRCWGWGTACASLPVSVPVTVGNSIRAGAWERRGG